MKKVILFAAMMFASNLLRAQWEPDQRLTNQTDSSLTSYSNAWCVAASGDNVHVVWYDNRDGNFEIYYKRSIDGGLTWGADTRLTNASAASWEPSIVVSGSILHVVWYDYRNGRGEIFYKRSEDAGTTWGADTQLTSLIGDAESPSIAISGSVLHVVWYDDRNNFGEYQIFYKRSTDGGVNWDSDTQLSTALPYSGFPSVAASGSVVHVVYEDDRNGNGDIYYQRSADGGQTWGAETRLTTNPHDSWDPCIALNDSVVHIVWMDNRNHSNSSIYDIYYKRSTDGGLTWGPDIQLTNASGDSEYPNLAVSGSMVHVVWEDFRDGNYEIYYKQSSDGGITWSPDTRLTNAIYPSLQPSMAISDSVLHVLWYDYRDMNYEIYYKRNPTGNLPVGIGNDLINNDRKQISIWPNPASNSIHINFNNDSKEKTLLIIRNILGEELLSKGIRNSKAIIDVSNLQNGLYFVGIIKGNNQTISSKLIILK